MGWSWGYLITAFDLVDLLVSLVFESVAIGEGGMPKAQVVHHMSGRIRLRIRAKRFDDAFFAEVAQRLGRCDNVHHVSVNPASASVLILYSGQLAALIGQAYAAGLAEMAEIELSPPTQPITSRMLTRLRGIDCRINRMTYGEADGSAAMMLTLLLAGAVQLARGQVFGAIPMLWYAGQAIGMFPTAMPELTSENRSDPTGGPVPTPHG